VTRQVTLPEHPFSATHPASADSYSALLATTSTRANHLHPSVSASTSAHLSARRLKPKLARFKRFPVRTHATVASSDIIGPQPLRLSSPPQASHPNHDSSVAKLRRQLKSDEPRAKARQEARPLSKLCQTTARSLDNLTSSHGPSDAASGCQGRKSRACPTLFPPTRRCLSQQNIPDLAAIRGSGESLERRFATMITSQ